MTPAAETAQAEFLQLVEHTIAERLEANRAPSVDSVIAILGMAKRTYQRRLKFAGTTHSKILDGVRKRTALFLASHHDVPVGRIVSELHFVDASVLGRAFKKWTGKSVREYRAELRAMDDSVMAALKGGEGQ